MEGHAAFSPTTPQRQPVRDQADTMPGIEPRVERSQARRVRGRRQVEPEEGERDVEQAPTALGLRMHQATASQSQGAGRVFGVMTSGMCQA